MTIIAIDPGPTESAYVIWGVAAIQKPYDFGIIRNDAMIGVLKAWHDTTSNPAVMAIEMIGHYGTGMPVGSEIFDTCIWIGRFTQAFGAERTHRLLRATIKTHICGSPRAKDANVRQALIDRFGGKTAIKKGGPLYKVSSHCWAALAVAITFAEQPK